MHVVFEHRNRNYIYTVYYIYGSRDGASVCPKGTRVGSRLLTLLMAYTSLLWWTYLDLRCQVACGGVVVTLACRVTERANQPSRHTFVQTRITTLALRRHQATRGNGLQLI